MTYEAAMIFLVLIALQLFLVTFQMDWAIHNNFVRDGTVFDTKFKD